MRESHYNIWVEKEGSAYVFNGISGSLLGMSRESYLAVRQFLDGDNNADCLPELLLQLAHGRMLVADDNDELLSLSKRYEISRNNSAHFALTVVTSLGCNFECPYCFEDKQASLLGEQVQQSVLRVLDEQLQKIKSFAVTWFGGEPLIGKKSLLALSDQFIERCDRAGVDYRASIITNGYLLDAETCAQLKARRVQQAQVGLDGPPEVHNRMRPLAGGKASFQQILSNLHCAVEQMNVSVRMNIDAQNLDRVEELLQILHGQGFAEKLTVYPGQIVGIDDGAPSPSSTYQPCCLTNREFAKVERQFLKLAADYGFSKPSLPEPRGAPCTAVRANELVVGSKGELYKCWDSVGNKLEVVGHIDDYHHPNGRLQKWLKYDPFTDAECCGCIALPVCMGGCAHHAMNVQLYENRCSTFRHTYREQVLAFVEAAEQAGHVTPSSR